MPSSLAINGGTPVRDTLLPYARQRIDKEDIDAVTRVLQSDWLTTGPKVAEFEHAFAACTGAKEAVAVSSGTAALHAAYAGVGIGAGDEVIVPAITFAATANAALYLGARVIFADVDPETLLLDPLDAGRRMTKKTKAIAAVDYAGQPCDYLRLREHGAILVADACHALGGSDRGEPVGTLADVSTFSFHPAKTLATGEGGMITTNNPAQAKYMRQFRNHGITTDHRERHEQGMWFYEMTELGWNYRITDFQCALGMSQLQRVPEWTERRRKIAKKYDDAFTAMQGLSPLRVRQGVTHAYHLYVVQLHLERLTADRDQIFRALRAENIGVNVHYIPVHLHPYYRNHFGTREGMCTVAEAAYRRILSLPMFASMTDQDADDVIAAVEKVLSRYAR